MIILFGVQCTFLLAQNERKLNRKGVSEYKEENFDNAELSFRKARETDSSLIQAAYNIANTLYKQEKYEEAANQFKDLVESPTEKIRLSDLHHNLGNSFLKNEKYQESIEEYKNALRLNPDDEDTRYNLAYAQAKLEQQQNQQNQDQQKDQQQQEQERNQQQDQQQNQQQNQNEQQEQQQPKEEQGQAMKSLSREDMERILQAIQQQEKMVQAKLEKEKAEAAKVRTEKDW